MIGRSSATRKSIFSKPTLTEKLIANAPNLDVHIIPDAGGKNAAYRAKKSEKKKQKCIFGIRSFKKHCHFNFGKLYRNAVQAIGGCRGKYHHGICSRRSCDLGRYKASDLQPDFFYCQRFGFQLFLYNPQFTLRAYDQGYPVTFLIMFLAALLTSSLAVKLKEHAKQSVKAA